MKQTKFALSGLFGLALLINTGCAEENTPAVTKENCTIRKLAAIKDEKVRKKMEDLCSQQVGDPHDGEYRKSPPVGW